MKKVLALVTASLCVCLAARAQERAVAFTGATLVTVSGPAVQDGVLVVHRGKIVAAGPRASVTIPPGAQVVDAKGKTIMPGLVDTHSHVGGGSGGDASAPIQPDVRILDSIDVRDPGLKRARAGGITTVNVMPGSGHLLSGQTLYLKLRDGKIVDDLFIRDARGEPAGGIKMANGTNALRPGATGPFPGTRSKSAALVREQFTRAQEYREKVRRAGADKSKLPPRDLALEALAEALEGRRVVHFHTHRHDDILTALRLAREFGFRPVLHHVSEAWKVADEIARAKAPASVILIDSPGGKLEAIDVRLTNGAALERAGALVGFHTDDYVTDSRFFLRQAGLAVRGGMSRERALHAMTMAGAEMLGLKDRVGSLEAGKDADFILLSGDPLSAYTKVLETWVEGVRVFDRNDPRDRLYAVGGYGAGRDQAVHYDCFEDDGEGHRQ
ncbi:MAG: amidohydrolase family protein [Acidobacteriota bacterium]|nr:amidohydrolase family protein [Acidobacteriota bacterium]